MRSTCSFAWVTQTASGIRRPSPCGRSTADPGLGPRWSSGSIAEQLVAARGPDALRAGRDQEHGLRARAGSTLPTSTGASGAFALGSIRDQCPARRFRRRPRPSRTRRRRRATLVAESADRRRRPSCFGSIRTTVCRRAFATQTAPSPTAIATGRPPIGTSASMSPGLRVTTATEFGSTTTASEPPVSASDDSGDRPREQERAEPRPPSSDRPRPVGRHPRSSARRAAGATGAASAGSCSRIAFSSWRSSPPGSRPSSSASSFRPLR